MATSALPQRPSTTSRAAALLASAHGGPSIAVTAMATAFAISLDLPAHRVALVLGAVLTGQLSVGWSNDLIDLRRDRAVGRTDKPLVTGLLSPTLVRGCCATAVAATVVLSLALGWLPGAVHLAGVAVAWTYNLGIKATAWSWLPYALFFGSLPVFVTLTDGARQLPPWSVPVAAALLGVGAHVLNVLPDLDDDAATDVHGWPHRLGPRWAPPVAVVSLAAATVLLLVGSDTVPAPLVVLALTAVAVLGAGALLTGGRRPFQAAVAIALVDVLVLVVAR